MGLNISQHRITLKRTDFDFIRYAGDKEFATTDDFERNYLSVGHPRDGEQYWRPTRIKSAIDWVILNIPEENQPRLLKALEEMEDDLSLYFYNGW